jgi:hypothetical protein
MGLGQSSCAKNDIAMFPHQERSMSDSSRGQKSIPKNAAIGPINLSGVTFKEIGSTSTNAEEEEDASSFNHRMLDDDDLSCEDESETDETDDDSDDEGKFTPRREFLMCDVCNKDPNEYEYLIGNCCL